MGASFEWITNLWNEHKAFNSAERQLIIDWQFKKGGHFYTALMEAMALADNSNLEGFAKGFPEEYAALMEFRSGNLNKRLIAWSGGEMSV